MVAPDVRQQLVSLLPRLRRFALILTNSADRADDLVQASLVRALDRLDQRSEDTPLDRWMFSIAKTVWLNTKRSSSLRKTEQLEDHLNAAAIDGVRVIEARLTLTEVKKAFEQLSSEQREVLLLVCVEGYTYRDAAEFLGVPVGTLLSRLSRARVALAALTETPGNNVATFPAKARADAASSIRKGYSRQPEHGIAALTAAHPLPAAE